MPKNDLNIFGCWPALQIHQIVSAASKVRNIFLMFSKWIFSFSLKIMTILPNCKRTSLISAIGYRCISFLLKRRLFGYYARVNSMVTLKALQYFGLAFNLIFEVWRIWIAFWVEGRFSRFPTKLPKTLSLYVWVTTTIVFLLTSI